MTDTLVLLRRDWQRSLPSRNLAGSTQRIYATAARQFADWLAEHNPVTEPAEIGTRDVEGFIEYMIATRTASTANVTYRALQQWFKWMLAEEEIERSPWSAPPRRSCRRSRCRCSAWSSSGSCSTSARAASCCRSRHRHHLAAARHRGAGR